MESGSVTVPGLNEFFLFRREVQEQSQAKPNRLRILHNSKPINPCRRGNLTLYTSISQTFEMDTVPYGLTGFDPDPGLVRSESVLVYR